MSLFWTVYVAGLAVFLTVAVAFYLVSSIMERREKQNHEAEWNLNDHQQ